MKSFSLRRALSPFLVPLAVGSFLQCGGEPEQHFTSQGDTNVMAGIVGTWSGTSSEGHTYTMSLCEDSSANIGRDDELGCQNLHVVRGNGHGQTEDVSEPSGGCNGGCIYYSGAFVTGTIESDDLKSTVIFGEFGLSNGDRDDLAFPYRIELHDIASQSQGYESGVTIIATMEAPGIIDNVDIRYPSTAPFGSATDAAPSTDESDASDTSEADASADDASVPDASDIVVDSGAPTPAPSSSGLTSTAQASATGFAFSRTGDNASCPSN